MRRQRILSEASRLERKGARFTKSRKHVASGSMWMPSQKADFSNEEYLTEFKYTSYRTWYLSPNKWAKIVRQAEAVKKKPRIIICFRPVAGIEHWYEIVADNASKLLQKGFLIHAESGYPKQSRGVIVKRYSPS